MENLDLILQNYKQLSTEELISIAATPSILEIEIIPYLQSELLSRNRKEEALLLGKYLMPTETIRIYKDYSKTELNESLKERIDSGESLESIKMDLKENGIDIFQMLETEQFNEYKKLELLTSLKNINLEEPEINEKMTASFGISEIEIFELKRKLRRKGKQNIIFGTTLVVVAVVLAFAAVASGGHVGFGLILVILTGIERISNGKKQRK